MSPLAPAASPSVVISQVYGGGGNSGATYKNDFIELFNRGNEPVNLTGWSVQYASASSWAKTELAGEINPGEYYLIQQAAGSGGTVDLPSPDATGNIALAAGAGKVALVNNSTATALVGTCPTGSGIVDFVGFGTTANCAEVAPTANLTNTTAAIRAGNGCKDTDNNSTDFATGTPTPRNTATTSKPCVGPNPTPILPILSISDVTKEEGNTSTTDFKFTVSLSAAATTDVTFDIATTDGTATVADADYSAQSLTAQTIPAGQFSYSFTVSVNGDTKVEDDETFTVTLSNPVGATVGKGSGNGTILNDDFAPKEIEIISLPTLVISQVYGGGGNSGAIYKNDFIELFNATTQPVSLEGWSVQYNSSGGTGNWQRTGLSGTIQPGQYYLVQQAAGSGGSVDLPTPDLIGTIAMAAGAGKVALVSSTTSLSGACPTGETIVDLVAYGTLNCSEVTGGTPTLSSTLAAGRKSNGCTDTNDNAADFATGAPAPRNSAITVAPCPTTPYLTIADVGVDEGNSGTSLATFTVTLSEALSQNVTFSIATANATATAESNDYVARTETGTISAGSSSYTFPVTVNGDLTPEDDETFTVTISNVSGIGAAVRLQATGTIFNDDFTLVKIHAVQGSGPVSPVVGQKVLIEGIVTGAYQGPNEMGGFYVQEEEEDQDNDPLTSEGIFVYTTATPVKAGDKVQVIGQVQEFPANATSMTQLGRDGRNLEPVVTVVSANQLLPTPQVVTLPVENVADLERLEGMYVRFNQTLTVTETYELFSFGTVALSVNGRLVNPTNFIDPNDNPASGTSYTGSGNVAAVRDQKDLNRRSTILLDDGRSGSSLRPIPYVDPTTGTLRIGSTTQNLTGVLSQNFSAYRLMPVAAAPPVFQYAPRPAVPAVGADANLKVASFNVLNYFNGDGQGGGFPTSRGARSPEDFARQRDKIIAALRQMDADVVGLIEMENDGFGPNSAIQDLVNGLNATYGSAIYAIVPDPETGVGTDQIKMAIIYKPATVTPVGASLSDVNPVHNRPPVAQTFVLNTNGESFTLIVNHFKSKGCGSAFGLNADQNDGQGCWNFNRLEQAKALVQFIDGLIAQGKTDILTVGDYNANEQEDPIDYLAAKGLQLVTPGSYSYVFSGEAGSLDHGLATPGIFAKLTGAAKWHINADEPTALQYDAAAELYSPGPFRSSDHDPLLAGFRLQAPAVATYTGATFVTVAGTNSSAPVSLRATVQTEAGDIRQATVTFEIRNKTTNVVELVKGSSVSLLSASDPKTGTSSATWNANIGSNLSVAYEVRVIVGGAFVYDNREDHELVTVSKATSDFFTGGGYLLLNKPANPLSAGTFPGDTGTKANFSFNAKYVNKGTELRGEAYVTFRSGGSTYEVRSTSLTSMGVNAKTLQAELVAQATLRNLSDPESQPLPNLTLQLNMTDKGDPGKDDLLAISLWDDQGQLLFSSAWSSVRTQELTLDGGNIKLHSKTSFTVTSSSAVKAQAPEKHFVLYQNYPNPFGPSTRIGFEVAVSGFTTLTVYNSLGQEVQTLFRGEAKAGQRYEVELSQAQLPAGIYFYTLRSGSQANTRRMVLKK